MKHILLGIIAISISTLVLAQPTSLPKRVVADKIIAVVGDKIILKSDIENSIIDMQRQGVEIPANAQCLILEQSMAIKALVLQAQKDSLPVTDEEVDADIDNRIRSFILQYGSKEELERIAGKSVYQLKEDFKEPIRDQMLSRAMRNKIVEDIRITPFEVKKYYSSIPKDSLFLYESEVEVSQIVIYPKASREAEEYCVQQLKDFKQQIESGKKDFKSVAELYSMDPGVKENGGEYTINRSQKDLDPTWLAKAFTLKEGQISNPFKTKFGYHILQLISRAGDDAVVKHILLIPQISSVEMKESTAKLDSIRNLVVDGKLSFGDAVTRYSDDEGTKFNAGQISGRDGSTYITIDQLDKDMVVMLKDLNVGEYSKSTEFTDDRGRKGLRVVFLKTKTDPHRENLKDDYSKVAQRALEEKKNTALEAWFNKKISSYYIMVDEDYRNCAEMKKWVGAIGSTEKK
jgi:peptidyl-prolyl cis-trans isomerase SurA